MFDRIYRTNGWRGRESRSGPGSGIAPTRHAAAWLSELVADLGVTSVLNVGCGDDLWTPELPGYMGIDVSTEAIRRAKLRHPRRTYAVHDARANVPGGFDLIVVRDVIQHLSFGDGLALLSNVVHAGASWLVASTYTGPSERHPDQLNVDIETGDCYCPDLTAPPFAMKRPQKRLADGYDYLDGEAIRDRAKWLGLWDLRTLTRTLDVRAARRTD